MRIAAGTCGHRGRGGPVLRDGELVASKHLDADAEGNGIVDDLLRVVAGRVEDKKKADKLEAVALALGVGSLKFLVSDSESMETTRRELLDISLQARLDLAVLLRVHSSMMLPVIPLVTRLSLPVASTG